MSVHQTPAIMVEHVQQKMQEALSVLSYQFSGPTCRERSNDPLLKC